MRKLSLFLLGAVLMTAFGGCHFRSDKLLSEDIEIFQVFAPEIAVLRDQKIPTNSKAKYEAAKRLAEGVDFSLTRSVETLEKIFWGGDAILTRSIEYGDEIAFYYNYQNHFVRFRFWRTKNAVTDSEVRIN